MKNKSKQFYVVSPDGFSIEREKTHDTPKLAWHLLKIGKTAFPVKGIIQPLETVKECKYRLENLKRIAH